MRGRKRRSRQGGWYRGTPSCDERSSLRDRCCASQSFAVHDEPRSGTADVSTRTRQGGPGRPRARGARLLAPRVRVHASPWSATADGPRWTFYEGPPTANGMPGTHHVEARVFKDVFPRFKTMKGYHVARKAGWDCHGLPVELAVEKELGFSGKQDIEAYGIAEFNAKCRESVEPPRRRVRGADRADGLLGRPVQGLLDDEPVLHRVASGGRSSRSSTRACWSRTTASRPTARAAAPACPTTSWRRATRPSSTRRCTSASR